MTKRRFTDADKWRDPWYMHLTPNHKLLWHYICDNCDNSGVWVVNPKLAEFEIGAVYDWAAAITAFAGRVELIDEGRKWNLLKFLDFQHPNGLTTACNAHKQIYRLLALHGLSFDPTDSVNERVAEGIPKGSGRDHAKATATAISKGGVGGKVSTRHLLAEFGIPNSPSSVAEWAGGLNTVACCRSLKEARAFLAWAVKVRIEQRDQVGFWRHVHALALEWDDHERDVHFRPAQPLQVLRIKDHDQRPARAGGAS